MTIVALHHTNKDMFAIADGLISRGTDRVIAEDRKIVLFKPRYQIPQARLGHFDGFKDYSGLDFGLAYAGNYTIISNVIKRFIEVVTRSLYLDRQRENNGKATIYQMSDGNDRFRSSRMDDSYNFSRDELLPITVNFLMNILQKVCAKACADFHANAMSRPEAQFALFGTDKIGHDEVTRCEILKCMDVVNGDLMSERFSTLPWRLNCIGDASVIPELLTDIESKAEYALEPASPDPVASEFNLFGEERSNAFSKSIRKRSIEGKWLKSREIVIESEVMRLIAKGTRTIGGDCTIARSSWMAGLTTQTIGNLHLSARFDANTD